MGKYIFAGCFGILIASTILSLLTSWILMLLWNWLVPELFNGTEITWLQSFGLMFLISLLTSKVNVKYNN